MYICNKTKQLVYVVKNRQRSNAKIRTQDKKKREKERKMYIMYSCQMSHYGK